MGLHVHHPTPHVDGWVSRSWHLLPGTSPFQALLFLSLSWWLYLARPSPSLSVLVLVPCGRGLAKEGGGRWRLPDGVWPSTAPHPGGSGSETRGGDVSAHLERGGGSWEFSLQGGEEGFRAPQVECQGPLSPVLFETGTEETWSSQEAPSPASSALGLPVEAGMGV